MKEAIIKIIKEALAKAGVSEDEQSQVTTAIDQAVKDQAALPTLREQVAKAGNTSTALNETRARLHAAQTILDKHNIKVKIADVKTEGLTVAEDGTVSGDYDYTPQNEPPKPPPKVPEGGQPLTYADVKAMTAEQINERWDEVEPVLKAGPPA